MSRIVVFLIMALNAIGFSGCAKYQTLPINVPFDVSKAGNVYEVNISITNMGNYMFDLEYWEQKGEAQREYDALKKTGAHNFFMHTTMKKILGDGHSGIKERAPWMVSPGSKIVLKLTVIPHQPLTKAVTYNDGGDPFFREHTIPLNKSIVIISDLSAIPEFGFGMSPDNLYFRYSKAFSYMSLVEGDYTIRIENLQDVPEVAKIKTHLYIGKTVLGK